MSVDLKELSELVNELSAAGTSVDDAIAAAERRLKVLRTIKQTLDVGSSPKPRTSRKAAVAERSEA